MSNSNPVLELRNVSVAYGKATALHAINLHVSPGEVIALIGANGAGKSTTLRAISGLLKPTNGDILLDGTSIAGQRCRKISVLELIFARTVWRLNAEPNWCWSGFPGYESAACRWRGRCRAVSSKCWRSAAP